MPSCEATKRAPLEWRGKEGGLKRLKGEKYEP